MGVLREMAAFLGPKARWTQEVRREVRDRARGKGGQGGESALHHRLSQLTTLNFPHDSKGARLSEEVRAKVTQLQSALAFDGSTRTHLGEIATVLHAEAIGAPLVLIDDYDGREEALRRGVPCVTTRQLAVEMALAGSTSRELAAALYQKVLLKHQNPPRREDFDMEFEIVRAVYEADRVL